MSWKTTLIPRRVAGMAKYRSVYMHVRDDGRARFFVMYGECLEYTATYPTAHEGLSRLASDYRGLEPITDGCPVCGLPLEGRNAKATYCSDACRDIATWRRKSERKRAEQTA